MIDVRSWILYRALVSVGICIESKAFDMSCKSNQIFCCVEKVYLIIDVSWEIGWRVDCLGRVA